MFMCIYGPPKQNTQYFLENLLLIIDHYLSIHDNQIILGDFNMESKNPKLASFMHSFNLYNSFKSNACFKGGRSCIDLILTDRKYCFKHTSTFETELSDHDHLIYLMLKTAFKTEESKQFIFGDYRNFYNTNFQMDLERKLNNRPKKYGIFEKKFENVLNTHAPKKT